MERSNTDFTVQQTCDLINMWKGFPQIDGDHHHLDTLTVSEVLASTEAALWSLNTSSGELHVSEHFYQMVPALGKPLERVEQLLALMPPADSYVFKKNLLRAPEAGHLYSCEICLANLPGAPRLRFIGQPKSTQELQTAQSLMEGVVVHSDHWLANPGPDHVQHWLSELFSESPIPSFITDADGVVLQQNQALEKLFNLTSRQMTSVLGRYNVLRDPNVCTDPGILQNVKQVYTAGKIASFEMDYVLGDFHKNKLSGESRLHLRVSLLPMLDRAGKLVRVLGQLQDFSREHNVTHALQQQDQLLSGVINNTQNLISVKSVDGRYLLVNRSFAQWVGKEPDEVYGKTDFDLFEADMAQRLSARSEALIRGVIPEHFEETGRENLRGNFVSTNFLVKDAADKVYGVGQVMTDISRQKLIEDRLENQRQELHLLLDSMRSAIWYFDRWGLVKDLNTVAVDLVNGPASVGKSFLELASFWDDAAERHREIMQVIRTGAPQLASIESAQINEELRWFSVDKIPTKNKYGRVNGVLLVMSDITDALHKERALKESEARYKAFIENSSEAIWCYDMTPPVDINSDLETQVEAIAAGAHLSECNQVLARIMGASDIEDVLGSGLQASGSQNFIFDIANFIQKQYRLIDHEIVREDDKGRRLCFQISCMGVIEDNLLRRVWGTTKDVTARKRYQERLEYQSTHDSLTKLPNRVKLYKEMEQWLRTHEPGQQSALLLIDLDRFKEINDTLGHQVGDHLLQLIGPRLEIEMADMCGIVARLGGDEFAIFLSDITSQRQAIVFAHRVLDALRQEFDVDGFNTEISASIGISLAPTQAEDVSTMMRYADVAMYRAKTEMSGLSVYDPEYDPHSPKRLAIMSEFGRAIRENQLSLHFQPKVSLKTGEFYGFEALLRWNHPELGFVPPSDFIPLAEHTSLIHPMTAWVLENSIAQCRIWQSKGIQASVAVNLSARNLLDENIPKKIMRLLQEYQLPPKLLELEITESSIMTDPARAMRVLDHLHELGVQLSIDDFGTGYSSLAYLKRMPVQTLKIDNSFVRNMLADKQDDVIVNSTIHLAHNLGLIVVAEGVENEELLQRLQAMGCDEAQGYHIGRPMPADKVDEWLAISSWVPKPLANS